jgi:hypothetical protein
MEFHLWFPPNAMHARASGINLPYPAGWYNFESALLRALGAQTGSALASGGNRHHLRTCRLLV